MDGKRVALAFYPMQVSWATREDGQRQGRQKPVRYPVLKRQTMKTTSKFMNRAKNHGLTVMEMLIGLAFLLILVAFVAPNLQQDFGRKEMSDAVTDFHKHLEKARFAARRLNAEITVDFNQDLRAKRHSISFVLPGEPNLEPIVKEYVLPENIRLHSPQNSMRFNGIGSVEWVAQIELTSERNSLLDERFLVE
jgi:hypothetical protein